MSVPEPTVALGPVGLAVCFAWGEYQGGICIGTSGPTGGLHSTPFLPTSSELSHIPAAHVRRQPSQTHLSTRRGRFIIPSSRRQSRNNRRLQLPTMLSRRAINKAMTSKRHRQRHERRKQARHILPLQKYLQPLDLPWQSAWMLSADPLVTLSLPSFLSLHDSLDLLLGCMKTSGRIIRGKLLSPPQAVLPATMRWVLTWSQGVWLEEHQWEFVLQLTVSSVAPGYAAVISTWGST